MSDELEQMAIEYHQWPTPGKLTVTPTKRLANQRDLSLAYSPGVAAACKLIEDDPNEAATVTARANLVAVISNGTAVLGLGNIGPLASKPVMEGKAVLFKKFAGVDVFDIEVDENDPDKLVDIIAALEPTFGGVNLEDIKAPECFIVEEKCRERMKIPVFHDDQHGTAICVAAAVYNGLRVVGKELADVRVVCSGAGAAALACLNLLTGLGVNRQNVLVCDRNGVIYEGREEGINPYNVLWARETNFRTLDEAIEGADIFLGLSGPNVLTGDMVAKMADKPMILALANPTPEIMPEVAKAAKPDAIIATGRSDYPNQVNNVLCFPFLFRGALDVGASAINEEMKLACVKAIADLAKAEASDVVAQAYGGQSLRFGPEYLIPKPFDPRLIVAVAPAVAQAAMDSGVATRPITDMAAYRRKLQQHVYKTGFAMRSLFDRAQADPRKVVYAEGEDDRVLRAAQIGVDDGLVKPVLIGRRLVIERLLKELDLRLKPGHDCEIVDPADYGAYERYADDYHRMMARHGVSPDQARAFLRTRQTVIGAMMVHGGDAEAMICGIWGGYERHLRHVMGVIGLAHGVRGAHALELLIVEGGAVFICDTAVSESPTADEIAEMALLAAEQVRRFDLEPKLGLLSHSDFGTSDSESAVKMREALALIQARAPGLEVEGEMRADTALKEHLRNRVFPGSELKGAANLLIMPNLDAANIAFNLSKAVADGISVGPILIGMAKPVHVVAPSITVRGLVNMTAIAVVDAQEQTAQVSRTGQAAS